jgi:hypothetical protein
MVVDLKNGLHQLKTMFLLMSPTVNFSTIVPMHCLIKEVYHVSSLSAKLEDSAHAW